MHEVVSSVLDTFMDSRHNFLGLTPCLRAVLVFDGIELALDFGKSRFISAKEAWIFDELAIGKSGKDFNANVNADFFIGMRKQFGFHITGEAGKPLARGSSANGTGFDRTFYVSVQVDWKVTNLRKTKPSLVEAKPRTRVGEGIILALCPSAWGIQVLRLV